jgi:hypothetical protein
MISHSIRQLGCVNFSEPEQLQGDTSKSLNSSGPSWQILQGEIISKLRLNEYDWITSILFTDCSISIQPQLRNNLSLQDLPTRA